MKSVVNAVRECLSRDEIALEAMQMGVLNLSAYAQTIQAKIEKQTWKPVKVGTITVALSRLMNDASFNSQLVEIKPYVHISDISIRSPLCILSFEKNNSVQKSIARIFESKNHLKEHVFFTVTQGVHEFTLIFPDAISAQILEFFSEKSKAYTPNVAGITVRFSESYMTIPNTIHSLLAVLAVERINVLEVVSTHTELAIIVMEDDVEKTLSAYRRYMTKSVGLKSVGLEKIISSHR